MEEETKTEIVAPVKPPKESYLIPLNRRTPEEVKMISRLGGKSKGKAKSEGAKLRQIKARLKKEGFTSDDQKWLLERIEDRASFGANVMIQLDQLKKDIKMRPLQQVMLLNTEVEAGKFLHGVKQTNTNFNLNVDVNAAVREAFAERKAKEVDKNEVRQDGNES